MAATTAAPPEAKLERVRKLLAKAEAFGVTEAESVLLTAKAAELMARYGIEETMLAAKDAAARAEPTFKVTQIDPPFHNQKKDMLARLGDAMSLHPVNLHLPPAAELRGKYRETLAVELFGSPADIERCGLLYQSLLAQATRLLRDEMPAGAKSAYKQSWLDGFSSKVAARVREAEKQAAYAYDTEHALTGTAHSTVMVLAGWEDEVLAFRAVRHPRLGQGKRRSTSGNGYFAGRQAGDRAQLGQHNLGSATAIRQLTSR